MGSGLNLVGFYGTEGTSLGGVASVQGSGPGGVPVNVNVAAIVGIAAQIEGTAANGAVPVGNPVWVGGWDGVDVRAFLTDSSGRQHVIGAGADGAAIVGDPVRVAGSDGANTRSLLTSAAGRLSIDINSGTNTAAQLPAALVGGRLDANIGAWLGSTTPTVGQKTMAASLPIAVASDQTAIPVTASAPTPAAATLSQSVINFATSGDHAVVAAVAAKTNRIYRVLAVVGGSCNLTFKDGVGGGATALTGPLPMQLGSAVMLDYINGEPYYTDAVNSAFNLNTDAAVQVSGTIWYTNT